MQVALRHKSYLEEIVQVLEYVGKHLPRIESFADLFVISKRIEKAVCDLYYDLVQFSFQAIIFLNRNPIGQIIFLTLYPNEILTNGSKSPGYYILHWKTISERIDGAD